MLNRLQLGFAAGCWLGWATPFVYADITGLVTVEMSACSGAAAADLVTCNVYVQFDNPSDHLLSMGFSDITTDDPLGFFQAVPYGGNTPPNPVLCTVFPTLCCDSFITIGCKTATPGWCANNPATPDGDFNSCAFNCQPQPPCNSTGIPAGCGQLVGGWFNGNPGNGLGTPDANLQVLVAQLTVHNGFGISGVTTAFTGIDVPFPAALSCFGCAPVICNDGNPCTDDGCNPDDTCFHIPNSGPSCNDGLFCNGADTCSDGVCIHPGNPCPGSDGDDDCTESCSEFSNSCGAPDPNGSPCASDGNLCTSDVCTSGVCTHPSVPPGTPCEADGNLCTTDQCDGSADCVVESTVVCLGPVPPCDVGQFCNPTTGMCQNHTPPAIVPCTSSADTDCDNPDTCSRYGLGGACQQNHEPNGTACTPDGNPCTNDYCNSGVCTHPPNDGVPCDDGDPCTSGDTCQGGCVAGTPVDCSDDDPCTADSCDHTTGDCIHAAECTSDAECDDSNPTTDEACLDGCCVSTPAGAAYALDIKSGKCPNKLKISTGGGDLKVYVAGDADSDVSLIDLSSLHLRRCGGSGSIDPSKPPRIKDKVTPHLTQCGDCTCHKKKKDYIDDVEIKFKKSEVSCLIDNNVIEGAYVDIEVYGVLLGGSPFAAHDCVLIVRQGSGEADG